MHTIITKFKKRLKNVNKLLLLLACPFTIINIHTRIFYLLCFEDPPVEGSVNLLLK